MVSPVANGLYELARNSTKEKFNDALWEIIAHIVETEVSEQIDANQTYGEQYMKGRFGAI